MRDLTNGSERSQIFRFALPMLIGNLFQQFYNIVDSIIVGNFINKQALAAVGASFPVIFTLISFVIGIGSGATIVISQFFGAKDYDKVVRAIDTTFIFMFFVSIIITALGLLFGEEIFGLLQLPQELLPQAMVYFSIYIGGSFVFFGFQTTSSILRGLGDSKTPLYFLMIATIFNVLLDLLFILVFNMGIAGAALATVISQGGAFVTAIVYLNRTHELIQFSFKGLVFDKEIFKKSLRIGLPTSFQQSFIAIGMTALMGIVNQFGTNVIAAYSVGMRLNSLATLPAMNFGSALSMFVGQNLGAGKIERVRKGYLSTLLMSATISVLVTLVVVVFGSQLMALFTQDESVISIGAEYLLIVGSFYIIFSIMFSTIGVLRGAGATIITMISSLLSLWAVRLPIAWWLSGEIGYEGIWWANPIGWAVSLVIVLSYYLSGRWKTKGVVASRPN
ncbi:Multidrug export protein MepA [Salinivirga cyanobacteriivorans]|uniref:Multidrug-efflux transporter n=1 Tax=Salinivirga cyanobacteriivorans TaxID=1307839 RepID=A0A0S2HYU7_9BACT|nr:MATE family efflux transporter [Salinivirga cyanobacteriivorans]ALO15267.1 Multidrug export protein MepA [Salinivirga cyanobacteriivorans]